MRNFGFFLFLMSIVARAGAAPEATSNFKMTVGLEGSSTLHEADDPARSRAMSLSLAPSYKVGSVGFSMLMTGTQETDPVEKASLGNTDVGMRFPLFKINSVFKTSLGFSSVIPTNEDTRKYESLQGSLGIGPRLEYAYKAIGGFYQIGATRNFHQYTTNSETGLGNIQTSVGHRLVFSVDIIEGLSLSLDGRYSTGWTYEDSMSTKFLTAESLSLEVGQGTSIYVGHANGGKALKSNGTDSNIKFFNDQSSEVNAGLEMAF